ncbi:rubrerythrin family protein [Halocatena halophila]|uniref:rubrerythrin family protein n=1 Tax=Halocatena halophila TaxID=2814576 RepID=UPI002ED654E8
MTDASFEDELRDEHATELSRLGSSKALYADTAGEMEAETVLAAVADAEYAATETFDSWATSESNAVASVFSAVATQERDHYETVIDAIDGEHEPASEPSALQATLREQTDTFERIGAFIGRTIVAEKSKEQVTGFFVGQADPQTAQTFRSMGSDLDEQLESGATLLKECDESERERAFDAASDAITAAYDEYTEQLEAMGVNPKPVC